MASSVVASRCAATCSASPSPEPSVEPGHAADGHAAEALDQLGVRVGARIGLRRAAVQHDHGDLQSSCPSRLEREQRVVYRAEPRAGDEHERKPEPAGEVGDRPVLAHRHEQPAGAFDDEQVVAARELRDGLEDHVGLRRAGSRAARPRAAPAARRRSMGTRRAVRRSRRQPPAAAWRPPPDRQPGRRSGPASRRRRRGHGVASSRARPHAIAVLPTSVSVAVTK